MNPLCLAVVLLLALLPGCSWAADSPLQPLGSWIAGFADTYASWGMQVVFRALHRGASRLQLLGTRTCDQGSASRGGQLREASRAAGVPQPAFPLGLPASRPCRLLAATPPVPSSWASATMAVLGEAQVLVSGTALAAPYMPLPHAHCTGRGNTWPFLATAAFPPSAPAIANLTMHGCGACFEVAPVVANSSGARGHTWPSSGEATSPSSCSVVVTMFDSCPGCQAGLVSLNPVAFSSLAPLTTAAIPVRYRQARTPGQPRRAISLPRPPSLTCPLAPLRCRPPALLQVACSPPDNIVVVVEQFSTLRGGWIRLHLEQARGVSPCWVGWCLRRSGAGCGTPVAAAV